MSVILIDCFTPRCAHNLTTDKTLERLAQIGQFVDNELLEKAGHTVFTSRPI